MLGNYYFTSCHREPTRLLPELDMVCHMMIVYFLHRMWTSCGAWPAIVIVAAFWTTHEYLMRTDIVPSWPDHTNRVGTASRWL